MLAARNRGRGEHVKCPREGNDITLVNFSRGGGGAEVENDDAHLSKRIWTLMCKITWTLPRVGGRETYLAEEREGMAVRRNSIYVVQMVRIIIRRKKHVEGVINPKGNTITMDAQEGIG